MTVWNATSNPKPDYWTNGPDAATIHPGYASALLSASMAARLADHLQDDHVDTVEHDGNSIVRFKITGNHGSIDDIREWVSVEGEAS